MTQHLVPGMQHSTTSNRKHDDHARASQQHRPAAPPLDRPCIRACVRAHACTYAWVCAGGEWIRGEHDARPAIQHAATAAAASVWIVEHNSAVLTFIAHVAATVTLLFFLEGAVSAIIMRHSVE